MPDWPGFGFSRNILTPFDTPDALYLLGRSASSGAVWPSASRALFIPIFVYTPVVAKRMVLFQGAIGNNIDAGIYRDDLSLVVSTGSVAMTGTLNSAQGYDITDTLLPAGRYYLALAINGTTGGNFRFAPDVQQCRLMGMFKMDAGFALPATAVPVAVTDGYVPNLGIEVLRIT